MAVNAAAIREVLGIKKGARLKMWLEICARCGLCAEGCHFFLSDPKPEFTPAYRNKPLLQAIKKKGELTQEELEWLCDTVYGTCNMCQRCTQYCPYGIGIAFLVRAARSIAVSQGMEPPGLKRGTDEHLEHGNNMAIGEEDYVETVEWQLEEVQEEMPDATAPIEKKGADILVTLNPRDIKFYPQNTGAYIKLYTACEADWTLPKTGWDATNYGLFTGDDKAAKYMTGLCIDAAERLGVKTLVSAE